MLQYASRLAACWLAGAASILVLIALAAQPLRGSKLHGFELNRAAPAFQLADLNGVPISPDGLAGKHVYLMFGYLGCTSLCHTQALVLRELASTLPETDYHFLYVAMDPARDSAARLRSYFAGSPRHFSVLRPASRKDAQALALAYGAPFGAPAWAAQRPEIEHPGLVFVINPAGRLRLVYPAQALTLDRLLTDLQQFPL